MSKYKRICGFLTLMLAAGELVPCGATLYQAEVTSGSCANAPLDFAVGEQSAHAASPLPPPPVPSGSGDAWAFGAGGSLAGRLLTLSEGQSGSNNTVVWGCSSAEMEVDDIWVQGPGTEVSTTLSIDASGVVSAQANATGTNTATVKVWVRLRGGSPFGGTVTSPYAHLNTSTSASTTLTTQPITVLTSQPLTALVELEIQGSSTSWKNIDTGEFGFASQDVDFSNTVNFTTGGPVLDLPDGFTADSVSGNIADNLWLGDSAGAGEVPDDLLLSLDPAGDLVLSWGDSCVPTDTDYAVYRGTIADFESHTAVACSTQGATTYTISPMPSDAYYLVVPLTEDHEGSYGQRSDGAERVTGISTCAAQAVLATCE